MKKELRSQIEDFKEYNEKLKDLSRKSFEDKKSKDIVSFWIGLINFELNFKATSGIFKYNSSNLSYGIDEIKFELGKLTSDDLNEILEYYIRKGYTLNQLPNIIIDSPNEIIFDWTNPTKQNLSDKIHIIKFMYSKLTKLLGLNRLSNNLFKSIILTLKDFYGYYFWNNSYCPNAMKLYKKTIKAQNVIYKRERKLRNNTKF